MNWSTSVYTTLSSDTEPSIVITFDSAKYIFNASENTTRAILQSKRGWRKVKALFLTQLGTQRSSGVPGLFMSVADSNSRILDVVGPRGLLHFLASMRFYVFRNTLGLKVAEAPSFKTDPQLEATPVFKDDNITVFSIPLVPTSQSEGETRVGSEPLVGTSESGLKRKREPSLELSSKRPSLDPATVLAIDGPTMPSTSLSLIDRFLDDPHFDPTSLEEDEADAWRRLIIKHMFTWIEPPSKPRYQPGPVGKKGKRRQDTKNVEDPETPAQVEAASVPLPQIPHWVDDAMRTGAIPPRRGPKGASPAGSLKPLPAFTAPVRDASTAYIVVGPRVRGKFDAGRAEALGLYGPLRGKVARGETVTFTVDDGAGGKVQRTVKPEDCMGEHEITKVVMIMDVPTPDHIESLVSAFATPAYSAFRIKKPESRKDYAVHAVYHLLGPDVLEDERYISFMNGFSDDTQHLISSPDHNPDPLTFTSAGLSQLRLSQLDQEMFPLPYYNTTPRKELSLMPSLPPQCTYMQPVMIDPILKEKDKFHPAMAAKTPPELPSVTKEKFTNTQSAVHLRVAELDGGVPKAGDELVVVPLGTNSAISSRYRNVSGQFIQIPDWGNLLLDAGEGTWGQMARYFGADSARSSNVWQALRGLKCIFISHAHADHHAGLAKILAMRKQLNPSPTDPLYLVSTLPIHLYLRELANLEELGLSDSINTPNGVVPILSDVLSPRGRYQTVECGWKSVDHSRKAAQMLCKALGLRRLNTVDVLHRTKAFGLVVTHQDGWRLVYSGDTMPSDTLAQVGEGATLLIHEATMADDQEEMARAKAHSTISQAIDVARRMRAQNVLLTHFSSRYPTMPRYTTCTRGDFANDKPTIALAMDHACIRVGDLWKMAAYFPAIEQSFKDIGDEGEEGEEGEKEVALCTDPS
ncbi:hypothetical protein B0F90DRAFT_1701754 [Multifurca ochricompacta]|uniref:ribonuclease Z n=1 Tax=Multifurca ochricompacta TaxID=376703 RepID=A0AAD4M8T5_9AGAM|nr:hypothetical protein B0F90DRAFT_1701754 [Multifurca ochricompacta]